MSAEPIPRTEVVITAAGGMVFTHHCSGCKQDKPIDEFYQHRNGKGGDTLYPSQRCKDCDNARERKPSLKRVLRQRARGRAAAVLISIHLEEYYALVERELRVAEIEADMLAQVTVDAPPEGEAVKLRPGPARVGQDITNRIDVGVCRRCQTSHDSGHACPNCGFSPSNEETS